jgi:dTDP-4-amino-4,6-dideoxygalactose transaminase
MIPLVDLRAQYDSISSEILAAVRAVFESSEFVLGRAVVDFEAKFAEYVGSRRALGVNSGTSALHLALLAAGVGPGDEVVTTPMTFIATASAVDYCGATPVFADVEQDTLLLDHRLIEARITPRTKAILPVHLHGVPADHDPMVEIAQRLGLSLIEDAALAHGAEYRGRSVGTIGHLGCFSFYPGKNLGAYGEGGAVTTDDSDFIRRIGLLRDWGAERRYHHDIKAFNYRMDGVQGAVLGVKMAYIERWTQARRRLAARYDERLTELGYRIPAAPADRRHVYHVYAIRHRRRDELAAFLSERGIASGIHYPIPVHLQKAFAELGHAPGDFPNAERAADELLSLPIFPEMTVGQQDHILAALADWGRGRGAE